MLAKSHNEFKTNPNTSLNFFCTFAIKKGIKSKEYKSMKNSKNNCNSTYQCSKFEANDPINIFFSIQQKEKLRVFGKE
jgi:hypothetical protein